MNAANRMQSARPARNALVQADVGIFDRTDAERAVHAEVLSRLHTHEVSTAFDAANLLC